MGAVVSMTYQPILDVSNGFSQTAQSLRTIAKVLEALITILRIAAFCGAIMAKFLADYLQVIKTKCEKLAKVCDEFAKDLKRAVAEHKAGDYKAGSYFGEGVSR